MRGKDILKIWGKSRGGERREGATLLIALFRAASEMRRVRREEISPEGGKRGDSSRWVGFL